MTGTCLIPACELDRDHDGKHRATWKDCRPIVRGREKRCSRKQCERSAVAEMNRGGRRGERRFDAWWGYCAEHLAEYGLRIDGDRVVFEWDASVEGLEP